MKNTYKICMKLNYAQESAEKQESIDKLISFIKNVMKNHGWREADDYDSTIDYVFSIGGDGTMMHTMQTHVHTQSVVIGINAGNVGFLTPYSIENVYDMSVFKFLQKNHKSRIEYRTILKSSFKNNNESLMAVNEFSITSNKLNKICEYSIEIEHNGQVSPAGRYKADTLLISGPCGSTAYNMNAGGAIVDPTVRCMQIMMIAPTILGIRPIIIGRNSTIRIRMMSDAMMSADGQTIREIMASDDEAINITLVNEECRVMLPNDWNFYSMLSNKLHWNNGNAV